MIIRKTISFDFLGEEYKDAYGVFASIPISEYTQISKTIDAETNSIKKSLLMLEKIKEKFLSGKWPDEDGKLQDLKKEELDAADGDLLVAVYNRLMGVEADPKVSTPSSSTSNPTDAPTPPSSS